VIFSSVGVPGSGFGFTFSEVGITDFRGMEHPDTISPKIAIATIK
jgi:hypothetical protein